MYSLQSICSKTRRCAKNYFTRILGRPALCPSVVYTQPYYNFIVSYVLYAQNFIFIL